MQKKGPPHKRRKVAQRHNSGNRVELRGQSNKEQPDLSARYGAKRAILRRAWDSGGWVLIAGSRRRSRSRLQPSRAGTGQSFSFVLRFFFGLVCVCFSFDVKFSIDDREAQIGLPTVALVAAREPQLGCGNLLVTINRLQRLT